MSTLSLGPALRDPVTAAVTFGKRPDSVVLGGGTCLLRLRQRSSEPLRYPGVRREGHRAAVTRLGSSRAVVATI